METALYFPYIRVPQTPWFSQVLLYWDQAATIVPQTLWDQPGAFDPYMRELSKEKLVRLLTPDDDVYKINLDDFDSGFLKLLEGAASISQSKRFTRLHIGKMSHRVFMNLHGLGLAEFGEGPEWETWWKVEETTANAYMSYLACAMSASTPGMLPVTDVQDSVGHLLGPSGTLEERLAKLRFAAITRALPAPSGSVPASELRGFKEQNADKLKRCRVYLDAKLADLAQLEDEALRSVKLADVHAELEDDVETLLEDMNRRKWPGVALVGFGGVIGVALATAAAVATGGTPIALGLGVGAGVFQAGAAGYGALDLVKKPRFNARAPLAYAALGKGL